jgi:hypothetical protein
MHRNEIRAGEWYYLEIWKHEQKVRAERPGQLGNTWHVRDDRGNSYTVPIAKLRPVTPPLGKGEN